MWPSCSNQVQGENKQANTKNSLLKETWGWIAVSCTLREIQKIKKYEAASRPPASLAFVLLKPLWGLLDKSQLQAGDVRPLSGRSAGLAGCCRRHRQLLLFFFFFFYIRQWNRIKGSRSTVLQRCRAGAEIKRLQWARFGARRLNFPNWSEAFVILFDVLHRKWSDFTQIFLLLVY